LAGGMYNLSLEEQTLWRELAEDLLYKKSDSYKFKLDIINPTIYYNLKNKIQNSELEVMKFDLRHVKSSSLILVNYNDQKSIGTAQELAVAFDRDIPIIGITNEKLHPWLECCTDKMFSTVEDAVDYIINFYLI
jgi:nucleoside 2-deoxyribosyltransferase